MARRDDFGRQTQRSRIMMHTTMVSVLIAVAMLSICSVVTASTNKTLVSWVTLADTTQQGGSALTIQHGDQFDGIVFGEKAAGKWMAGSDFYSRSQAGQQASAVETADGKTLIQIAIVYKGNQIFIYRNGEPYASYEASNIDLLNFKDNMAVFGLRHVGAGSGQHLRGSIEDARIYDRALSAEDIKKLAPKTESEIKPYAWWTFEKDAETDRMGRFPVNNLSNGAKIEGGRLVLETEGATMIASAQKMADAAALGPEIPAMPANPPEDWLSFHLVHPGPGGAYPGDPNCAFYWKGRYHLHYIYSHDGVNFAHVSSDDMVHWKWQPTNLNPRFTGHGMFSGTGFFTKDGKPAIIYHGWGSGRNQIAIAQDDNLETWSKPYPLQPKVRPDQDGTKIANWDPDAWLDGDNYYALSGGNPGSGKPPTLFKSTDLKNWDYLGLFLTHDMPDVHKDEDISCPNFFEIGDKHMLLCISHNLGCRYYLGEWKDEKFMPDFHARMTWNGNEFFAPESVLTKDKRRVMWAWLLNLPIAPTGVQALPRELELPKDGVLRIRPLRELESLRYDRKKEDDITVASDAVHKLKEINGNALELELVFKSPTAKEFGLDVLCDQNGENGLQIAVVADSKTLRVGKVNAPFELRKGEDLTLRVFIDKNLVEVFANDRQAAVAAEQYAPEKLGISLFSKGGDTLVKQVKGWKMKSARCTQAASSEANTLERISVRIDPKVLTPVRQTNATGRMVLTAFYSDGSRRTLRPSEAVIQARTKAASGNVNVVAIEGDRVAPKEGGIATVEAAVIQAGKRFEASTDVVVAPFFRDYHQTLVLKLFLGMEGVPVERLAREPLFQKDHDVMCTFEEALEVIRRADNLTRGIPKIIYLVGWQKGGHDHCYPAWDEVNPRMKRAQDAAALDSLRWLIREARQYNTTVSLHINMVDAYKQSHLWDEYAAKDCFARELDGTLRVAGIQMKGEDMYNVVYPKEWQAGLAQRRIDGLIKMIPELKDGHTIHVDVFVAQRDGGQPISPWHAKPENGGLTPDKYVETQRKIFHYWRERGFDVTGEGTGWAHPPGEHFIGLQAMSWWYSWNPMEIPECLGARGRTDRGGDGDFRFGSSMHGEEIWQKDKENMPGFLGMFCRTTLPWYYLSRLERQRFENEALYYSDGVVARTEEGKRIIRRGEFILRENDDLVVPALWNKQKEIIAYSREGYANKSWRLPAEWSEIKAVDLYRITLEGCVLLKERVPITDAKLVLSLGKDEAVSIVPKGARLPGSVVK